MFQRTIYGALCYGTEIRDSPFDERFINYGFNKVQWIEYLRYLGYEYYILSRSFAFDIPHAPYVMFMCLM